MRAKSIISIAGALIAVLAVGPSGAAAATEFGDNCPANETTEASVPATLFAITATGDPLPLTAPSGGVITEWKLQNATAFSVPQALKVIRQTGELTAQVVGESAQTVAPGANRFMARIPVQTGDRLGLATLGKSALLFCLVPGPENLLAVFEGAPVGANVSFTGISAEAHVPVAAVIEPDADNDGYGDETQDKCPQLAAFQTACPVVALSVTSTARKSLVTVLVTASLQAPVTLTGTVKLGKGKTANLSGGTQTVAPNTIAKFTMPFPKKLGARLKELSRKRSLSLDLTATAPNLVGAATTSSLKVKLKGQAKPKAHKKS